MPSTLKIERVFLSGASADYKAMRPIIAGHLHMPDLAVAVQEDFHAGGGDLLTKLEDYIRVCDLVVHLIGRSTGSGLENELDVAEVLDRLEGYPKDRRLSHRFPHIYRGLREDPAALSYTQWEFWLAKLHRRQCLALYDASCFPSGLSDLSGLELSQRRHVANIRQTNHELTGTFTTADSVCNSVWKLIHFNEIEPRDGDRRLFFPGAAPSHGVVGRDDEVELASRLFSNSDCLILWGAGGSGKTTLAQEIYAACDSDRTLWIDLLRTSDADGIRDEILKAIYGLSAAGGRPQATLGSLEEQVVQAMTDRVLNLIVLDNAEHVPDATGELARDLFGLPVAVRPKVLITSQDQLLRQLPDAARQPVEPLTYPDPSHPASWTREFTAGCESATLLLQRSRGRLVGVDEANWEAIATICYNLRGQPLTLRLAGGFLAQHPELTLADLAEQVRANGACFDREERSESDLIAAKTHSARASVQWSISLLAAEDRQLLTDLAHLPDGFTAAVVERLPTGGEPAAVAKRLSALCGSSILKPGQSQRFRMDEAVRRHLLDLSEVDAANSLRRCLETMRAWLEAWGLTLACNPEPTLVERLTAERGNVRALLEQGNRETTTRRMAAGLLAAYAPILDRIGPAQSVVDTIEVARNRLEDGPPWAQTRLCRVQARSLWLLGKLQDADRRHRDHLNSLISQADPAVALPASLAGTSLLEHVELFLFVAATARIRTLIGFAETNRTEAATLLDAAEDIVRRVDQHPDGSVSQSVRSFLQATLVAHQAQYLDHWGEFQSALTAIDRLLESDRWRHVPVRLQAELQNRRGLCAWRLGELELASEAFGLAREAFRQATDVLWEAGAMTNQAFVLTGLDQFDLAIDLCFQADTLHRQVGNRAWQGVNELAWGVGLIGRDGFDAGYPRLERALAIVQRNDSDTTAQCQGEMGRALLDRGRIEDLDRATTYLELAVEEQAKSRPNRRLFGNYVLLAEALARSADVDITEVQSTIALARQVAQSAELVPRSSVLQVRRDFRRLQELEKRLS